MPRVLPSYRIPNLLLPRAAPFLRLEVSRLFTLLPRMLHRVTPSVGALRRS